MSMEKLAGSMRRKRSIPIFARADLSAGSNVENGTWMEKLPLPEPLNTSKDLADRGLQLANLEAYQKLMQSMENDIKEVLVAGSPSPKIARIEKIEIDDHGNEEVTSSQMTMWTPEMVYLLIDLYPKFHEQLETSARKKDIWKCIAKQMLQIGGFRVEGERCREKWKNMLGHYRRVCMRKYSDVKPSRKRDTQPFYVEQLSEALQKTGQIMTKSGSVVSVSASRCLSNHGGFEEHEEVNVNSFLGPNFNQSTCGRNSESFSSPKQIVEEILEGFKGQRSPGTEEVNGCNFLNGYTSSPVSSGHGHTSPPRDTCIEHCESFQKLLENILRTLCAMKVGIDLDQVLQ